MSERDLLAAEYALGLLDGEALLDARGLIATDSAFASAAEDWQERLAPLFEEVAEQAAPESAWPRIRAAIAALPADGATVVELRRKLGFWKGLSAAASAAAASLALVVGFDAMRAPSAIESPSAPIMVASLMSPAKEVMLSAACEPDGRTLTLMPGKMAPPPGRAVQLWLIPADGRPRSLGMVDVRARRITVEADMAEHFHEQPMLALSIEPPGGAPGGQPSGPMVASGQLRNV
jgi:anti-sigma-K factor RskA